MPEYDFKYDNLGAGTLNKLTLTIDRPKLTPDDIKKLEEAKHKNPASE